MVAPATFETTQRGSASLEVATVFEERLRAALPLRAERVLRRIRETRGGKLYDSRWSVRQSGEGNYAAAIRALFERTTARLGLSAERVGENEPTTFERPSAAPEQMKLF